MPGTRKTFASTRKHLEALRSTPNHKKTIKNIPKHPKGSKSVKSRESRNLTPNGDSQKAWWAAENHHQRPGNTRKDTKACKKQPGAPKRHCKAAKSTRKAAQNSRILSRDSQNGASNPEIELSSPRCGLLEVRIESGMLASYILDLGRPPNAKKEAKH